MHLDEGVCMGGGVNDQILYKNRLALNRGQSGKTL